MRKVLHLVIVFFVALASSLMAESIVSIPDNILGVTGEVAMAPVLIDDATDVRAFDCTITYDTTLLDLSGGDIKTGSLTSGWCLTPNVNDTLGWAKVSLFTTISLTGGSGSLLELDFHVIGPSGTSDLTLSGALNEDEISASFNSGSINVVSEPPIPGDANLDGRVDDADALTLATNWQVGPNATWGMGNFNGDGYANDVDATIMAANWHVGMTATGAVPEPGMVVLLAGVLLTLLTWQRGRVRESVC